MVQYESRIKVFNMLLFSVLSCVWCSFVHPCTQNDLYNAQRCVTCWFHYLIKLKYMKKIIIKIIMLLLVFVLIVTAVVVIVVIVRSTGNVILKSK